MQRLIVGTPGRSSSPLSNPADTAFASGAWVRLQTASCEQLGRDFVGFGDTQCVLREPRDVMRVPRSRFCLRSGNFESAAMQPHGTTSFHSFERRPMQPLRRRQRLQMRENVAFVSIALLVTSICMAPTVIASVLCLSSSSRLPYPLPSGCARRLCALSVDLNMYCLSQCLAVQRRSQRHTWGWLYP